MTKIINFPGGAGGNWLISLLTTEPIPKSAIKNWHNHTISAAHAKFRTEHLLTDNYDILYSGSHYYNFYLNVLYKYYYVEQDFDPTYQGRFNKLFEVARWLNDWNVAHGHKQADIFFDHLINEHLTFYENIVKIQDSMDLPSIDFDEFLIRRSLFFDTCIKTDDSFGNFDSMAFVIFVLAWLERQGIFPTCHTHFIMNDPNNQELCKRFALDNYHLCPDINHHVFESGRVCPNFLSLL